MFLNKIFDLMEMSLVLNQVLRRYGEGQTLQKCKKTILEKMALVHVCF